jgi:ribosomal RNA assembly protein
MFLFFQLSMTEYSYELKIPKERVAVLIGKSGEVKKQLESETRTRIRVDSDEGDVFVSGEDAISLFSVREIIKAIGRGFNPEVAMLLMQQDYMFEIIDLLDYADTKKHLLRLKGRVIGSEGKSRRIIEELTETNISVYGKTISLIGRAENIGYARRAVESLLQGSLHSHVYKWLEGKKREMKMHGMLGPEK